MKVISTGTEYKIYDSSIETYDQLPAGCYNIVFNPRSGFSLVKIDNITINEKIYGLHQTKINKVIKSFSLMERNLGIILSGDKGIGKSLFAKLLMEKGIFLGYPVIIVNNYIPGISTFINSIKQEIFIFFDEFDKTFSNSEKDEGSLADPQTEMLSLFDGTSIGKKLFVITCNSLNKLNDYLVNRPGRFHYHFRFDYPSSEDITNYLSDNGVTKEEINKVIAFSLKIKLNYDCLRAIAFELIQGQSFEDAILDLNIVNLYDEEYSLKIHFNDNFVIKTFQRMDLFSDDERELYIEDPNDIYVDLGKLTFIPSDSIYDNNLNGYIIQADDLKWELNIADPERKKEWLQRKINFVTIKHKKIKNLHYKI